MLSKNAFGVDLGTSVVKIYSLRKNRLLSEHDMIAVMGGSQVIAVGNDAYEMFEKNPPGILVDRPMVSGRIADVAEVEMLLVAAMLAIPIIPATPHIVPRVSLILDFLFDWFLYFILNYSYYIKIITFTIIV